MRVEKTTSHLVCPVTTIGAGGIGCWFARGLQKVSQAPITLFDGDTVEERNLDRQLFSIADIGKNKAEVLATSLGSVRYIPEYLHAASRFESFGRMKGWIIACVDNHPARKLCLELVDRDEYFKGAILCGNEYESASARVYLPEWKNDPDRDPRLLYPEIMTDESGSPVHHCTGEAQEVKPQLAISNMLAAAYALHLLWFYETKMPRLDRKETEEYWPTEISSGASFVRTDRLIEHKPEEPFTLTGGPLV